MSLYYGVGQPWDDHKNINENLRKRCPDMDQASAALLRDLKRRGLLEDTLVVWGGEFGRTSHAPVVMSKPGVYSFPLRDFGNWLRLRAEVQGTKPSVNAMIYLAMKE